MSQDSPRGREFWYGIYTMGIALDIIEPLEGANEEKWLSELSKEDREKIENIRDASLDAETQEVSDKMQLFFDLAKGAVKRDQQPDS